MCPAPCRADNLRLDRQSRTQPLVSWPPESERNFPTYAAGTWEPGEPSDLTKRDAATVESRVKQHASAITQTGTQSSGTTAFGPEFVHQSVNVMKRGLCRFLLTFAVLALPQQTRSLGSVPEMPAFHR